MNFRNLETFTVPTVADHDGLTAAWLRAGIVFVKWRDECAELPTFLCSARRVKKKYIFTVVRWVGRNFVKCVEYCRKICEKTTTDIP